MRILVVQETDWIKRGPHQQHHLMDRMALRGHEVRVIDHDYFWKGERNQPIINRGWVMSGASKVCENADITLIRPGILRLNGFATASELFFHSRAIKKQIAEFNPDVVVAFGILNAYLGLLQAKRLGIPFVYYLIDHLHTLLPFAAMRQVARQFEKATIRGADKILVINKGLRDYVVRMGGTESKIDVISAGVDLSKFNASVDGRPIRARYGIREDDVVLFFMGFMYSFSGLKEVANDVLNTRDTHIKLLVVGDGDLYAPLQHMAAQDSGRIILTGKVPFSDIPDYLAAADVCILPAYKTPTMMDIVPIKMYEYMAAGKPIIATRLPGIVKEFGDESGVVYVDEPGEVLAKADELIECDILKTEGERASLYVEDKDWETIVTTFEDTLNTIVRRNVHRAPHKKKLISRKIQRQQISLLQSKR